MKMKKNKVSTLAIAAVTSLALVAGGTLAWFVAVKQTKSVNIDTGTIALNEIDIDGTPVTNRMPGEIVELNKGPSVIKNAGSRRSIIEVSVNEGAVSGKPGTPATAAQITQFPNDYAPGGADFTFKRLLAVLKYDFATISVDPNWVAVPDSVSGAPRYYTMLEKDATTPVGEVNVIIDGELGGGKIGTGGIASPLRQFEQASKFKVGFTVRAVQAYEEAVKDYFGTDVEAALPAAWFTGEVGETYKR